MGRSRLAGVAVAVLGMTLSAPVRAELTAAQTIGATGGRILGAAAACDLDDGSVERLGQALMAAIERKRLNAGDGASATTLVSVGYDKGKDDIDSGRQSCEQARAAIQALDRLIGP